MTYSINKTPGQWKAHGHYIARESVTQKEHIEAVGFSATENAVNVPPRLVCWQGAGDERMFKNYSLAGIRRADLERHTRDLMKRVERSLSTKLEWVAVVHHNTEHPHVHIALRGIDEHGAALTLPRAFIQYGIRRHAEELATRELGFRTELDALEAQHREVQQLRFTSLDRIIQRSGSQDANYITVTTQVVGPLRRFARSQEHYVQARLAKLEQIGLAAKTARHTWLVRADFEDVLRTMQRTNDRQKMLARHCALLSDQRLPLVITPLSAIAVLEGRLLGHGHAEDADRPYLLLEGVDGRVHLLWQSPEIEAARRQGQLRVNSFVRIQKYSAGARPFVSVQDFGNSWKLLQNDAYFQHAAMHLIRNGVRQIDRCWAGWLGEYQRRLSAQIVAARDFQHQHRREMSRGR